jgi:hypothetical protein
MGSSACFFFLMNSLVRHDENSLQVILKEGEVGVISDESWTGMGIPFEDESVYFLALSGNDRKA